jgi:P27 family predicted phage terminase small subunit
MPDVNAVESVAPMTMEAPADLGSAGRELWGHVTRSAVWLAETDKPMLALLCQKVDRRNEYLAIANSSEPVLWTDKGYAYANPIVGMLSTLEGEITKLAAQMGLTPTERSRMGLAEVKARNAFEDLLAKRRGPDA